MIKIKRPQELERLRRLALAAQGLLQAQPYGCGLAGARKAINHIGYVQVDTISVVEQHDFDEDLVIAAFAEAITRFCHFQECDSVSLTKAHPKHLTQRVRSALKPPG